MDFPLELLSFLRKAQRVAAFGAGVSQESGLVAFRDEQGCGRSNGPRMMCSFRLAAASLAYAACEQGALVVEINAEPTPLTGQSDFFYQGKSGQILTTPVKAAW